MLVFAKWREGPLDNAAGKNLGPGPSTRRKEAQYNDRYDTRASKQELLSVAATRMALHENGQIGLRRGHNSV